jgi:CHAD domain-containing protein
MARQPKSPDPRALAATGALAAAGAAAAAGKVRATRRRRARKFELAEDEPMADGVRRIAHGQLDIADQLDVADERSVHEARKAFKRLRALVRLTRDQLGDEVRRRENVAFRDAGRGLSGARDARVLVETLDALAPERFAGLRAAVAQDGGGEPDEAAVKRAVADARERVETWPLGDGGADALAPGMKRIRKRGRRAYKVARRDPSSENLHELRKRTKDLWHGAQILSKPKLARRAHKLSDLLGEDHDLATLLGAAQRHADTMTPDEHAELTKLTERRRANLQRKALRRASNVY